MNNLTYAQIDRLIAVRESITSLSDWQGIASAVDNIDAVLRSVAPGRRNDVDLLLGRMCAILPERNQS